MSASQDGDGQATGPRLYKARGPDGEVAWVDHEALWRLQQAQVEELRRKHARRRRLGLLALVGLVAAVLGLVLLRSRIGVGQAPVSTAAAVSPEGIVADSPTGAEGSAGVAGRLVPGIAGDAPAARDAALAAASSQAAAEPGPSSTEAVTAAVRSWAEAWARQDLPAYLVSYAGEFTPAGGMARPSWERQRRRRLLEPASIRVEIEQLEIELRGDGRAEARFVQRYRSPSYSDVVRKSLELVEEEGSWRIVAERAEVP